MISPALPAEFLDYELRLMTTRAATGYFTPVPRHEPDLDAMVTYLRDHPKDEYMHRRGTPAGAPDAPCAS